MDLLIVTRGPVSSLAQRKAWVSGITSRRPTHTAPRPRNGHGRTTTTTGDAGPPIETATTAEPAGLQPVPVRVMIVDDHRVAAEALSELLARYPNIEVVGWAAAVSEALAIGDGEPADVAIIDFRLSDQRWSDAAAAIRFHWPGTSVVIVNADENDDVLIDAIEAGVAGYLIKSATGAEVVAALRRAVTGEALFPARRLADVLARQRQLAGRRKEQLELLGTLTPRELEILTVMARGLDNRAMARELGIGYSTVRSHVRGVLEKLGAHSKLEAVARAMELDLLHTHS